MLQYIKGVNMNVLDHVVNQLADAVAKGMSLDIAGAIIIQSYQATSGLVKISSCEVEGFFKISL